MRLIGNFGRLLNTAKIVAATLLLIYLPALIIIGLLVLLTSQGPAFVNRVYRRPNGGTVDLWEFRTECWLYWETTPVGTYLRRSNLYRLPSLFNVIRGDVDLGERVKPAAEWRG